MKREIKIIQSHWLTHDITEFTNSVNELLNNGWILISSSSGSLLSMRGEDSSVISVHSYTAILEFKNTPPEDDIDTIKNKVIEACANYIQVLMIAEGEYEYDKIKYLRDKLLGIRKIK